jgi:hypothetical protein
MNAKLVILMLLTMLVVSIAASTAEVSVGQLEQLMSKSTENLSSYAYSRSSDSSAWYSNASIEKKLEAFKTTSGKVDIRNESAWWSSKLATERNGKALNWQSYFIDKSAYLNVGKNWTKLDFNNASRFNYDFNELLGQIGLIENSNMKISGSEKIGGKEYYKLIGKPDDPIYKAIIDRQILLSLFASQIEFPEKLKNQSIDTSKIDLMNISNIVTTAWVSKDNNLLERLDINSSLTITPQILNISSPDFKIKTTLNESTVYNSFGSKMKIELPKDAQIESSLLKGKAWSRAVLGSISSMN